MQKKDIYFSSTGRRKTSSARIFLKAGKGAFHIKKQKKPHSKNSKANKGLIELNNYFVKPEQIQAVLAPLEVLSLKKSFDIFATVKGGVFTGQAGAIRHGLARALLKVSPDYRDSLKKNGFLTRDSRMVERKKYGRHKARKSTQFSKR